MSAFKDNFSKQSDLYLKFRPQYPQELYSYLSSLTKEHETVWDCGTGNGQAAVGLAAYYDQVIATDPSPEQIRNCLSHEKVSYKIETAENSSIPNNSLDLLTIANALHWFNFETFFAEAKRVLKKEGVIAAWAYGNPFISAEIDKIINHFHDVILKDYWLPENRLVEKGYATIPFPFDEINSPEFFCEKMMSLSDFIGFLNTWSATQHFIRQNNFNPTDELVESFRILWKNDASKKVRWKLVLKVARVF